jgi:hypothetical protein
MIQVELIAEDGFHVVEGLDEFLLKLEKNGTVEVIGAWDGKCYYVHEVGDQIYLLNQRAQHALIKLADVLISDVATKRLH